MFSDFPESCFTHFWKNAQGHVHRKGRNETSVCRQRLAFCLELSRILNSGLSLWLSHQTLLSFADDSGHQEVSTEPPVLLPSCNSPNSWFLRYPKIRKLLRPFCNQKICLRRSFVFSCQSRTRSWSTTEGAVRKWDVRTMEATKTVTKMGSDQVPSFHHKIHKISWLDSCYSHCWWCSCFASSLVSRQHRAWLRRALEKHFTELVSSLDVLFGCFH